MKKYTILFVLAVLLCTPHLSADVQEDFFVAAAEGDMDSTDDCSDP